MKRLYRIIILFIAIFLIGIALTVKSINNSFTSEENTIETVTVDSSSLKYQLKF